jgi:hypothetical protein
MLLALAAIGGRNSSELIIDSFFQLQGAVVDILGTKKQKKTTSPSNI